MIKTGCCREVAVVERLDTLQLQQPSISMNKAGCYREVEVVKMLDTVKTTTNHRNE